MNRRPSGCETKKQGFQLYEAGHRATSSIDLGKRKAPEDSPGAFCFCELSGMLTAPLTLKR
jgi:hypothetical protein